MINLWIVHVAPGCCTWQQPGAVSRTLRTRRDGVALLVLRIRFEHEIAQAVLRLLISEGAQQREAAALSIDRVLARRERDVAAVAATPLPDGEPEQLQTFECAIVEMQLGIREFAARVASVVWGDLD